MAKQKADKTGRRRPLFGNLFNEVLEVPPDLAYDLPRLVLVGNFLLEIENHRGILESDDKNLKLKVNGGMLNISGRNLCLTGISADEVRLMGEIDNIELLIEAPVEYGGRQQQDWE